MRSIDTNVRSSGTVKALTMDVCTKSLKTLGFHPLEQRHALLELALSGKGIDDLSILHSFPHIMYLDISNNHVSSLSVLENMNALIHLKARNNKITECLNFAPPHCRDGNSWPEGKNAVGSMLTLVDLTQNSIRRIGDLSAHRFLKCLLLAKNNLSWVEGLQNLRFLQTLDLSGNKITRIEGLDNLPIRELRLAHNQITSLDGLDNLPCLSALDVSFNQIKTLQPLQRLPHLTHVNVAGNALQFLRQTEYLTSCTWLHVLYIDHNPCTLKPHYRLRVIYRLPNLKQLDEVIVSTEEKVRAFNLYRAPEGDVHLREAVLREHCPDLVFEDFAPQQLPYDEELDIMAEELALGELLPAVALPQDISSSHQERGTVLEASEIVDDQQVYTSTQQPGHIQKKNNDNQFEDIQQVVSLAEPSHFLEESMGYQGDSAAEAAAEGFYGGDLDQVEDTLLVGATALQ